MFVNSEYNIDDLLQGLNNPQKDAVRFKDGPLLVLAGPGSGKTRVVTHRIAALLRQGVPGWRVIALTFTNKAATEMKNRLEILVPGNRVWLGTFHSFCARLLRHYGTLVGLEQNFTIYDTDQSRQLLDRLVDKHTLPAGVDVAKIMASISWAKNNMVYPETYTAAPGNLLGDIVAKVYPQYQEALLTSNAVDFDDLLLSTSSLLQKNPELRAELDSRFEYILVDEYQDTNLVQYAIVRALSIDHNNLGVTGDPDQSIYGWRGASIRNILEFENNFKCVQVIRLEQNYRSTPEILEAASCLIKHNKQRKDKELTTENPSGCKVRVCTCNDQQDEAESIAKEISKELEQGRHRPGDYAVFYRMNALSRNLEHAFHRYGVPFQLIRGLEFFGRREVKDLLAWFQLLYNPNDAVALRRVINLPARGIGQVTLNRLENFAAANRLSLLDATAHADQIPRVTTKARHALKKFSELIQKLTATAIDNDLEVLLSVLLNETGYLAMFNADSEEDKERQANVQELLSEVREFDKLCREEEDTNPNDNVNSDNSAEFDTAEFDNDPLNEKDTMSRLGRFLERTALVSDVDALDSTTDRVCLMSLHAAKGLEFPIVYIIALEDSILPHERSLDNTNQIEEERRLMFVGMTRAKQELRLSHTRRREFRGFFGTAISSRFLFELPPDSINCIDSNEDDAANQDTGDEIESQESEDSECFLSDLLDGDFPQTKRNRRGELRFDNEDESGQPDHFEITDLEFSDESSAFEIQTDEISQEEELEFTRPARTARKPRRENHPQSRTQQGRTQRGHLQQRRDKSPQHSDDSNGEIRIEYDDEAIQIQEASGFTSDFNQSSSLNNKKKKNIPFVLPGSLIKTAAELDGKKKAAAPRGGLSPDQIQTGELVRHRSYGLGNIVEIQGPSSDRIVTVTFFSGIGTVDLPVSDPDLSLVRSGSKET